MVLLPGVERYGTATGNEWVMAGYQPVTELFRVYFLCSDHGESAVLWLSLVEYCRPDAASSTHCGLADVTM